MTWLILLGASALLLGLALWLALRARRGQEQSGLPQGKMVYADTGCWSAVAKPYFSARHGLTGKPDYLVETAEGLVPVEVKRTAAPAGGQAYASHIMQLAAYCLLVEEAHGQAPPHGLIRYADATVQIDYTPALRQTLLDLLDEIRQARRDQDVQRSHEDPARCRHCGVRHACGEQALISMARSK
jgi:CRISPR-associated exonuclease Cas4